MIKTWESEFLETVERYLKRTGTPPTSLGRAALNDPAFVIHLRDGRSPSLRTADRVRRHIDADLATSATKKKRTA